MTKKVDRKKEKKDKRSHNDRAEIAINAVTFLKKNSSGTVVS